MPSKKPPNLFDPTPWLAYSQAQSTTAPPSTPSLTAASPPSIRTLPQPKILANAIKTITKTTTTKTSTYHLGSLIKTKEVTKERKTEYFQPEDFPPLADVNTFPDVAAKDATDSFCHAEPFAENFASGDVKVEESPSSCGTSTTMSLEHSNDEEVSVELPSPYSEDEESEVSSRHRSFNVTVDHVAMSDTPRPGAPKAAPPRSPLADVDSTDSSSSSSSSCPSLVPKHIASSDEAAASKTGELVDTTLSTTSIASPPSSPGRLLEPPHRGSALHEQEQSFPSPDPRSDYYAHHALDAAVSQSADLLSSASSSSPTNSTFNFQNFQTTALRELEDTLSATGAIEESSLSIISGSSSRNFHRGEESALRDIAANTNDSYDPYGENSSATFLGSPPCCSPGSIQASEDASGGGCRIGCFGEGSPGVRTASAAEVELESAGVSLRERVRDLLDNIALQVSGSGAATGTPTPPGTARGGSPPSGGEARA